MEKQICKIKGYENIRNIYYVTDDGKVYSYGNYGSKKLGRKKELKQYAKTGNYLYVALMDNNSKVKYLRIHRIVASAFIANPDNKKYVNHKDENRQNNDVKNLEWVTPKENNLHSLRKKLYCYDLKGNLIKEYEYTQLVEKDGLNRGCVCSTARGEIRQYKNMIFSYKPLTKKDVAQRLSKPYYLLDIRK